MAVNRLDWNDATGISKQKGKKLNVHKGKNSSKCENYTFSATTILSERLKVSPENNVLEDFALN